MNKIGIIADDLTGGTTVGTLMARSQIKTSVYFSSQDMPRADEQQAIVLTSDSRHLTPDKAQSAVYDCFKSLKKSGATYFSKRIDTTLRGGIGYEIDAMLDHMSEDAVAIVVPSMPQSNRIVVGGYSVIEGQALSETDVSKDVLNPVTESNIPKILHNQSKHKIGELDLGTILSGASTMKEILTKMKLKNYKVVVCDAINLEQISKIAQVIKDLNWDVLAVDPGPFTQALALARGFGEKSESTAIKDTENSLNVQSNLLVVAGSATEKTKKQLNELSTHNNTSMIHANPNKLLETKQKQLEQKSISKKVINQFKQPDINIVTIETAISNAVLNLKAKEQALGLNEGEASQTINLGLANIVDEVLKNIDYISGLYLTGGDTMVTTLKALGAKGIELIDYVIPQTDLGKIIGGSYEDLLIVGKGGLTGDLHTAIKAVNKIYEEYQKENLIGVKRSEYK